MLYLASVAGSVAGFLTFLAIISGIGTAISMIGSWIAKENERDELATEMHKWFRRLLPSWLVISLLASIAPGRETMMLIAASEMGQRLVQSQQVQGIADPSLELLRTWIQRTTDDLKRANTRREN
jgi:hypothetical protein